MTRVITRRPTTRLSRAPFQAPRIRSHALQTALPRLERNLSTQQHQELFDTNDTPEYVLESLQNNVLVFVVVFTLSMVLFTLYDFDYKLGDVDVLDYNADYEAIQHLFDELEMNNSDASSIKRKVMKSDLRVKTKIVILEIMRNRRNISVAVIESKLEQSAVNDYLIRSLGDSELAGKIDPRLANVILEHRKIMFIHDLKSKIQGPASSDELSSKLLQLYEDEDSSEILKKIAKEHVRYKHDLNELFCQVEMFSFDVKDLNAEKPSIQHLLKEYRDQGKW